MERMKLTEKEKDQIVKRGAEAMSKIIERMSIEMGELEEENKKLKEELEWYKTEHERLVDKLVIKGATELLDRKFENKKGWQGE